MRLVLTLLCLFSFAGCMPTHVVMENPKTGQQVVCGPGDYDFFRGVNAELCAEKLEEAGWKRVPPASSP